MAVRERHFVEYQLANFLETLRLSLPYWVRRILPRWFKNLAQDIQWHFYRRNSFLLDGQIKFLSRPILLITVPKSGTHLLRSILLLLSGTRWRGVLSGIGQI